MRTRIGISEKNDVMGGYLELPAIQRHLRVLRHRVICLTICLTICHRGFASESAGVPKAVVKRSLRREIESQSLPSPQPLRSLLR